MDGIHSLIDTDRGPVGFERVMVRRSLLVTKIGIGPYHGEAKKRNVHFPEISLRYWREG